MEDSSDKTDKSTRRMIHCKKHNIIIRPRVKGACMTDISTAYSCKKEIYNERIMILKQREYFCKIKTSKEHRDLGVMTSRPPQGSPLEESDTGNRHL